VAFGIAAIAILLRMLSDWLFATGGPLSYQLLQVVLLLLALLILRPRLEIVFLRTGQTKQSIRDGALAIPLAFLGGLIFAYMRFGRPQWPTFNNAMVMIANNLFFPVVEELEFRGFFLAWLLGRKISPTLAVWLTAIMHLFAHVHLFWQGNFLMVCITLLVFVWYGWLTLRTRSLWGAFVAHTSVNIFSFLPTTGSGIDIMRFSP
jgi:membrane protease YdiL (CAAX protease family)